MPNATLPQSLEGLHHLTVMAGAPHRNYAFYHRLLQQPLVKQTVNFDDPTSYHLYYGDPTGRPGTLLTFFPGSNPLPTRTALETAEQLENLSPQQWGMVEILRYPVSPTAFESWRQRLSDHNIAFVQAHRLQDPTLQFRDPDGLTIEIYSTDTATTQLEEIGGLVIGLRNLDSTGRLLESFGYHLAIDLGHYRRYRVASHRAGEGHQHIDLAQVGHSDTTPTPTRFGAGLVHHLALRVRDRAHQDQWREYLSAQGFQVTPSIDRNYFESVYFRGPEGVLYELATDPPGMAIDEEPDKLGQRLMLPPQYEKHRAEILSQLAPLTSSFVTRRSAPREEQPKLHLVGLHGTGGDENDLVPILERLAQGPSSSWVSLRGPVLEGHQRRFFRRLAEGLYDQRDLSQRSQDLAEFLSQEPGEKVLVGFSNGANLAAHCLMFQPTSGTAQHALLLRPLLGWAKPQTGNLEGKNVLILAGSKDPIAPIAQARQLAQMMRDLGATVELIELPADHALTPQDLEHAKKFLEGLQAATTPQ